MAKDNLAGNRPGIDHEIEFWKGFVESERFKTNWLSSPNPEMALYPELQKAIAEKLPGPVLDLGCGVISYMRGSVRPLYQCDLLAHYYGQFFDYQAHGEEKPQAIAGESLLEAFGAGFFSLINISNALDHCQDPALVMDQAEACLIPGGTLIVHGFENEASFENWNGLHQWNLSVGGKELYLSDKDGLKHIWTAAETWMRQIYAGKIWIGAKFVK